MRIYLDNAATTYPKPQSVYSEVLNYMVNVGSNPGRGAYSSSLSGSHIIYECREALMNLFNFNKLDNIIFTPNITVALNILLKSVIKDGWHIITTSMEHNSVLRPLNHLQLEKNIEIDILTCSKDGILNTEDFKKAIKPNTKLVVMSHASNVVGNIQPIETIGKICKEKDIYFIIDSAQTAGTISLDFNKLNCNALAFTGHKGLLGPQGTGGFLIDDKLNLESSSFIQGGTGSLSESTIQPDFLPDKFESGTLNSPGIAGLLAGIKFINSKDINFIRETESFLCKKFTEAILNMNSIKVYGFNDSIERTSTISVNSTKISNSELGFILDHEFGIMTRTGLHCAPLAHKTIGTFPEGTIRFSFGPFNTENDINYTIDCIHKVINRF